jgi:hypothetical protein
MENSHLNRRYFLKGTGVSLGLPLLESFASPSQSKAPVRLLYLGLIYGVTGDDSWFPTETGSGYKMTPGLKPLAKHKKDITIFGNLGNSNAKDSHYSCTTLLTGANLKRTPGKFFHNSISCDQTAAKYLGKETRFNSIELTCKDPGTGPGRSLAWDEKGKPLPGMMDPVEIFNHLFSDGKMPLEQRRSLITKKKSVLDAIREDSKSLKRIISKEDNNKLDEYFESIREIEGKLVKVGSWLDKPKPNAPIPEPAAGLSGMKYMKVMYDLIIAAFQTDSTRVLSFSQPLKPILKDLKISYSDHQISHHVNNQGTREASQRRDIANTQLLSYLIDKLKATKDFHGQSLFDNCFVNWSSGIRSEHILRNVPTIVTGGGGGKLKHGSYVMVKKGQNRLSNLWLTSLKAAGVPVNNFSDSNGLIEDILV